jgi:hypothetical protein
MYMYMCLYVKHPHHGCYLLEAVLGANVLV